jgi:phosphotriesterase-related protein
MIQCVSGAVAAQDSGDVLVHEHIICVSPSFFRVFGESWFPREKVVVAAAAQLKRLKEKHQVALLVDATPPCLGRDIRLLEAVSQCSGVHIVASCGLYYYPEYGLERLPPELLADYFAAECAEGIEGTSIRPGILKCAAEDAASFAGVEVMARVQKLSGLPLFAHSQPRQENGYAMLDIFEENGANLDKIVIGHAGDAGTADYARKLLQAGCMVSIDRLYRGAVASKAAILAELIAEGYEDRLLMSHDFICYPVTECEKAKSPRNPAEFDGLSCIHEEVIPALRNHGVTEEQIRKLRQDNPRRLLAGAC